MPRGVLYLVISGAPAPEGLPSLVTLIQEISGVPRTCLLRSVTSAPVPSSAGTVAREMLNALRLIYFAPAGTREAGFIETGHFGIRLPHRRGHFDLTEVSQRWLRDLLWDHLAGLMRSANCPRSRSPFDQIRRAITELSAFLEAEAPGGGHDPVLLREEHMTRFVADQRHRERNALPSLIMKRGDGTPSTVTINTRRPVFNYIRKLLREALDSGHAHQLGLDHAFIIAMPSAGGEEGAEPLAPSRP